MTSSAPAQAGGVSAAKKLHKYKKKSQLKTIWNRLKKNRLAIFGLVLFLCMLTTVVAADCVFNYEEDAVAQHLSTRFKNPSSAHLLGTDQYGRDVLARVIYGGRISLFVGLATICVSLSLGSIIGASAAYSGGKVDNILMRLMDMFLAIPNILMAITLVAALGSSLFNLILAMGISQTPRMSRIVRSSVLGIIGQDYIEAARSCGTKGGFIILKHILPNAIGPIIVQATMTVGTMIIWAAGVSFLGMGIQPPTPEWGAMLSEGRVYITTHPHLVLYPGLAIAVTALSLNLMGDGLRDALDPRLKD